MKVERNFNRETKRPTFPLLAEFVTAAEEPKPIMVLNRVPGIEGEINGVMLNGSLAGKVHNDIKEEHIGYSNKCMYRPLKMGESVQLVQDTEWKND